MVRLAGPLSAWRTWSLYIEAQLGGGEDDDYDGCYEVKPSEQLLSVHQCVNWF